MMKTTIKTLLLSAAVMAGASSCLSLDTPPYDRETDLTYWTENPDAAVNALNSCYNTITSMQEQLWSDTMSDNAYMIDQEGNTNAIGNGSFTSSEYYVELVWDSRYSGIRYCNELLTNIDKVPGLETSLKNRYIAEAKVIRAYHYYELFTKFGDVPYTEDVISIAESQTISRTPRAEVVSNILSDLSEVIDGDYLPASYDGADKGRITKWTAMAVKAKIHLFESQWEEVRDLTSRIITEGGFSLFRDPSDASKSYSGLFEIANEGNSEVILDVQYTPYSREHRDQYNFLPPSLGGYASMSPLQELVDSYIMLDGRTVEQAKADGDFDEDSPYDNRDPRLKATIAYPDGPGYILADGSEHALAAGDMLGEGGTAASGVSPTGYYFKKFWDNTYRAELYSGLNPIVIRYADVLLMYAEALAELGEFDATAWNLTIRDIRDRAGFTSASALDYPGNDNIIETIRNERRCELAFEGLRHKDIMRWRIAENVMDGWCHGMKIDATIGVDDGYKRVEQRSFDAAKHYLWPIPQADRDLNGNLSQNPNW